ncbi:FAD-binding oxidoreductase [Apiospora marii]|uniref:FAD-binding oxidoreductase n=1 Tax=Apiospora marii TaxID=335849 RepID=A0ABR1RC02_9PEZI
MSLSIFLVLVHGALIAFALDICVELDRALNQDLFLPNEIGYSELSTENWSQTAWASPACIFRPVNAAQLQSVIGRLVQSHTKFAIRSGGHSPSPRAANIDNGVLIDLAGLDHVNYDAANQIVTVGAGLTWGQVYSHLDPFNVTVVGGRVDSVGVGGLTLGGGLSYLSDLYGLVCDNVVNFQVVLADGSLVDANATHNGDLFWALKGGTNNFGVVTSFTMSTYPISTVWAGIKAYTLDDLPALFDAMLEYQSQPVKDPYANLMMQGFMSNATVGVVLNLVYLKPEESPAAFAPFYHINTTSDSTKLTRLSEFISGQGPQGFPPRVDWRTTAFKPTKGHYEALTGLLTDSKALEQIKSVTAGTAAFGLQPISARVIHEGRSRGGNTLGLSPVNQTWFVIDSGCWFPDDDALVHDATRSMIQSIELKSKEEAAYLPYLFMSDSSWDQEVILHYGPSSNARLRKVQAQYDPDHVFQHLVPGGFKLPWN